MAVQTLTIKSCSNFNYQKMKSRKHLSYAFVSAATAVLAVGVPHIPAMIEDSPMAGIIATVAATATVFFSVGILVLEYLESENES